MESVLLRSFSNASPITTGSYARKAFWHKGKIQKEYNFVRFQRPSLNHHHKRIEASSRRQEYNGKYCVKAVSAQSSEFELQSFHQERILDSIKSSLDVFSRFCRPLTLISAAISITSVSLLVVEKLSDISPLFFTSLLKATVALLFMNLYVVGVNHLSDVEIDKINKPYRPIASGEYSFGTGVIITASSLILSFWHTWMVGSWPLFWTLFVCFMMGSAYSVNMPLLRWKKSPVLAATSILVMRGLAFQLGFYLHMQTHVYKRPIIFSRSLIFATLFMSFFYTAMSLLKDIPDIEGDKIFGIQSFAVLLGQKRVFWICIFLLQICYGVGVLMGATSPYLWSKIITGLGHALLASVLWYRAKCVDLKSNTSTDSFYTFIWKLVCAEYLLLPFVR